eukprot:441198-Pelagomonas_calceolata.AAC.3
MSQSARNYKSLVDTRRALKDSGALEGGRAHLQRKCPRLSWPPGDTYFVAQQGAHQAPRRRQWATSTHFLSFARSVSLIAAEKLTKAKHLRCGALRENAYAQLYIKLII